MDELGDRMKLYENAFRIHLPIRMPVVLRVDGKCFSTLTANLSKPFDSRLMRAMDVTAAALCKEIQNAKLAYTQSDEISVLITPYTTLQTQPWVENNIQKTVSIAASIAGATFSLSTPEIFGTYKPVYFDARAFILPKEEVNNYFIFRQKDAIRNSISAIAQSLFSHKELNNKNSKEKQEMIFQKSGKNWNNFPVRQKRGRCIVNKRFEIEAINKLTGQIETQTRSAWVIDNDIPFFNIETNYINKFVYDCEE